MQNVCPDLTWHAVSVHDKTPYHDDYIQIQQNQLFLVENGQISNQN